MKMENIKPNFTCNGKHSQILLAIHCLYEEKKRKEIVFRKHKQNERIVNSVPKIIEYYQFCL